MKWKTSGLMRTTATVLIGACAVLTACDGDDFFPPRIVITTPTSAPTYTTAETEVTLGGTVELALDVSAENKRTGTRYFDEAELIENQFVWNIVITDLQIGDNPITVTAHGIHGDDRHASINVIRIE